MLIRGSPCTSIETQAHLVSQPSDMVLFLSYCKSTKFGMLLNLADLALGQNLNRII